MKVRIEITKGPDIGRNFTLEPNEKQIIGRGENVQIRMIDELISREHCEIEFTGKILIIRDLGSTNSTFVQQNLNEPVSPHQDYQIENQTCFFVGPESRFLVIYEHSPEESAQAPGQKSTGNSNFSSSLVSPANRGPVFGADSSIFNLTGHISKSPGLDDVGQPPKRSPPKESPPKRSPPKPARQPEPAPPRRSKQSTGYDSNSIVPPGQQGLGSAVFRDQVDDDNYVDESHLKSTPSVVERSSEKLEPAPEPSPPPSGNSSPLGSLVPPAEPSENPATTGKRQKRAKADTTPVSYPPRDDKEKAPTQDSPFDSIASPGLAYPDRVPSPDPPTDSSEPTSDRVADERARSESAANVQPNGLYFHNGMQIEQVSKIIAEIGEQLSPIFCVDLTRVGLANGTPKTDSSTGSSNFDQEDGDETPPDSPIDSTTRTASMVGIPLFEFLPTELQRNGPLLMTRDEFDLPIEESWHQDGLVVFFGKNVDEMVSHLKKLISTNIQSGKPSRSMFGYCWPSVLHAILECQSGESVARVFGDCISCIMVEDPLQRFDWSVIAQRDLTQEFACLGKG